MRGREVRLDKLQSHDDSNVVNINHRDDSHPFSPNSFRPPRSASLHHHRRVSFDCDVDDSEGRKMAGRLGFALEGERMKDVLIEVDEDTVVSRNR